MIKVFIVLFVGSLMSPIHSHSIFTSRTTNEMSLKLYCGILDHFVLCDLMSSLLSCLNLPKLNFPLLAIFPTWPATLSNPIVLFTDLDFWACFHQHIGRFKTLASLERSQMWWKIGFWTSFWCFVLFMSSCSSDAFVRGF